MSHFKLVQGAQYLWKLPVIDSEMVCSFGARYNLSFPIVHTLIARGLTTSELLEEFLFSTIEKDVAHPSLLKDADKAVARILLAIKNGEKILIAGDYDVDGITSSALLLVCLQPLGANINFFLPNRVRDGYGLSTKTVQRAHDNKYQVVITVDNGITAFEPALLAKKLGIDLIITDHHRPYDHLPEAYAVVDPYQEGCAYPYKKFAGVGVSFKLMVLLYELLGKPLPEQVYELLLFGTVADVVPLTGENRFWVRHGLQKINLSESMALRVLKQNVGFNKPFISSSDIGFFLAPQINALGRLEDARAGVKFLIGADQQETEQVGRVLHELNEARKLIDRSIFADVEADIQVQKIDLEKDKVIIAARSTWPSGVIGLVASRCVGAYGLPTILFHVTIDGLLKGSCRSIPEFDMFEALSSVQDLLISFGGHPMAAGLSLKAEFLPQFKERLSARIAEQLTPEDLRRKLRLDGAILLPDVNKKLMSDLALLEPFGCENAQPLFYVQGVTLLESPVLLKEAHVKCVLFADGIIKPVIFFNRPKLYAALNNHGKEPFDVAVHVTENHWNGKVSIELQGVDIAGVTL